jgi:hypothetical protein
MRRGKRGRIPTVAPMLLGFASLVVLRVVAIRRRRHRLPAQAVIISPRKSTVIERDGAVRSVQSAELTLRPADVERLWNPKNLENLARTYWRFLSRVTLGLIRVRYGRDARSVALLGLPITLLRFAPPEYLIESDHGNVTWQIRDGLLVARAGRGKGHLSVDVRREAENPAKLRIEIEVANFYSSIAAGFSRPVYELTQSAIHVLVTHAFLRSLATLDLAPSRIGALAVPDPGGPGDET